MVQMARLPEELVAISNRNGGRPSLDVALALVSALGHFEEGFVPHLTTIARHSLEMCRFLDLGDAETQRIRNAALIHDIGKIAIPPIVINCMVQSSFFFSWKPYQPLPSRTLA